jgi:MFS family permease
MIGRALQEVLRPDWTQSRPVSSLPCVVAIALGLFGGLLSGHPAAGMIAASGAMSVGFGSFQRLGRSRARPMLWAAIGMTAATACGSLAAHSLAGLTIYASALGLLYGLMTGVSGGTGWISLQCAIFGIVATGYPAPLRLTAQRALMILSGGLLQLLVISVFSRLHTRLTASVAPDSFPGYRKSLAQLRESLTWRSPEFRFAVRLGLAMSAAALLAYWLGLHNGYWVPMTTLLILRTDLHETLTRGLARMAGTIVGAGLITLLLSTLRPIPVVLALLVVFFAWLCYSVVMVNYGALSASVTAYIACLLAIGGLPEKEIVLHRIANTCLGGAIALLVSLVANRSRPREIALPLKQDHA